MDDAVQAGEIASLLKAGEPVLVTGPHGSGKFRVTDLAFRMAGIAAESWAGDLNDWWLRTRAGRGPEGLILCADRIAPGVAAYLRHFLATTPRTVALVAASREGIDPGILELVKNRVEVK